MAILVQYEKRCFQIILDSLEDQYAFRGTRPLYSNRLVIQSPKGFCLHTVELKLVSSCSHARTNE